MPDNQNSSERALNPEPKFGEWLRGTYASETNPQRDGMYVRTIRRAGRMNPGTFYELTDGNGRMWCYPAQSVERVAALTAPAMLNGGCPRGASDNCCCNPDECVKPPAMLNGVDGLTGDETDSEVIQHFLRMCREMKPVGQWPGERLCVAIERLVANQKPFRFIAEADMSPLRGHNGRGGDADRMTSGPRRAAGNRSEPEYDRELIARMLKDAADGNIRRWLKAAIRLQERLLREANNRSVEDAGTVNLSADNRDAAGVDDATFAEWLATEMPAGTVIGDPAWWANRIARQYRVRTTPTAAPAGEAVGEVAGIADRSYCALIYRPGLPVGTKLYTHPPAAEVREVDAESLLDALDRAVSVNIREGGPFRPHALAALRAALSPPGRAEGDVR